MQKKNIYLYMAEGFQANLINAYDKDFALQFGIKNNCYYSVSSCEKIFEQLVSESRNAHNRILIKGLQKNA